MGKSDKKIIRFFWIGKICMIWGYVRLREERVGRENNLCRDTEIFSMFGE